MARRDAGPGPPPPPVPWQFLLRAALVVAGLVLLLIVHVRGFVFYLAWALIVLALASEAAATCVAWTHARRMRQNR